MRVNCTECPVYSKCIASIYGLSELDYFKELVVRKNLKKNELIYSENQTAGEMLMIIRGNVKLTIEDDLPYPLTIRIAHPGEFVGLEAIIKQKYSATASCISDLIFCVFNNTHIDTIIRKHDANCQFLITELLNQVKRMYDYSLSMITGNSTSKVAQSLLALFGDERTVEITKEEIALMTGSSRETISRILSEMKRKNIINTNQKTIILINKEGLRLLSKKTKRK